MNVMLDFLLCGGTMNAIFEPHYYTRDLAKDTENVWIFFPHENWWEEDSLN